MKLGVFASYDAVRGLPFLFFVSLHILRQCETLWIITDLIVLRKFSFLILWSTRKLYQIISKLMRHVSQ